MPGSSTLDLGGLRKRLEHDAIRYLLVQFVDIHGAPKAKLTPAEELEALTETGAGFAGGAVWGSGQGPHSPDMFARIDPETYTPSPIEPGIARFAATLYVEGKRHAYCPRGNLERLTDLAASRGYLLNAGIEPEFFLVERRPDGGIAGWDPAGVDRLAKACYDYHSMAGAGGFLRELNDALRKLDWGVYQTDHEDANYQYEVNFKYADALTTADRVTYFRMLARDLAQRRGAVATFMPKPFADRTGSGAHLHFHLADIATGKNLFADPSDPRGLGISRLGYQFLGGVFAHARAICAVASPTVNCYKRLQAGAAVLGSRSGFTWTPACISYGDNNRTQMIRIPGPGHCEDRSVSSAVNPYLLLSAYLQAGLDGIARELDPGEPNLGNLYAADRSATANREISLLPQSLAEALDALERDPVIQEALGPIAATFLDLKRDEWRSYHGAVSAWEIDRYLTSI